MLEIKTRILFFQALTFIAFLSFGQKAERTGKLDVQAGLTINMAATSERPTGPGLHLQTRYRANDNIRLSLQIEPTLLAEGGYVQDSDPPIRGGANYLVNNYLSVEFLLGQERFKENGKMKPRFYLFGQTIMSTHRVYTGVGDERERKTYFGIGTGIGCDIGRWDLSTTINFMPDDELRDYVGLNVGFAFWRQKS